MDGGGWMMDLLCGREERRGEERRGGERRTSGGEGETTPKWERQAAVCNLPSAIFNLQSSICSQGPADRLLCLNSRLCFCLTLEEFNIYLV
jgi:hypothetical protein